MTNPDELESARSRVAEMAGWLSDSEDGETLLARSVALEHAADLRLILSANREMREALEACLTAMVEYGDGTCGRNCEAMITEDTPFPDEIARARSALTTHRGGE